MFSDSRLLIMNSTFSSNIAEIEGGCIKWVGATPNLINLVFLNNRAVYGDDLASYPLQMEFFILDQSLYMKLYIN